MRLDEFDPNAIDVEDQRGSGGRRGFPIGGRSGGIGCGTLVIALAASYFLGVDPGQLLGGLEQIQQQAPQATPAEGGTSVSESCSVDAGSRESCNALSSLNKTWQPIFAASRIDFARPKLVFYSQAGSSGCGAAQSAMGPFYCPTDKGIYLDTDFFRQMDSELGAKGQFARDYVIAHEYGHHIQNLLGMSDQVRSLQSRDPGHANQYSVRLELQADCYAGVWAAKNRDRLEAGDMESGMNAAHAIGDDTLMRNAGQRPSPERFTHGTSAQRMEWLRKGMETGNEDACDTFADLR
ncbi:MAG: neutral zinc metallopeptidase [Novosphingobium sp.]|uniref:KPN_02809 family neutral zinc metallopeptidase n=1 Tax=Novosphingobium sp. TaxID=1874826 RepID=UPI001D5D28A2|nr:neutral zinc metallopeptidase [Novosphingobium sp.]MCB2058265.1 neutral zinc metallopeptidase [Novosphingobium sp.]MCP5386677.1 neutral zinc metallopeptidase [Novosphingobium sp.]